MESSKEKYPVEKEIEKSPILGYVARVIESTNNALLCSDKPLLNRKMKEIFRDLEKDTSVKPIEQIRFALMVGNYLTSEPVTEWPRYDTGVPYKALCDHSEKFFERLTKVMKNLPQL